MKVRYFLVGYNYVVKNQGFVIGSMSIDSFGKRFPSYESVVNKVKEMALKKDSISEDRITNVVILSMSEFKNKKDYKSFYKKVLN